MLTTLWSGILELDVYSKPEIYSRFDRRIEALVCYEPLNDRFNVRSMAAHPASDSSWGANSSSQNLKTSLAIAHPRLLEEASKLSPGCDPMNPKNVV
jgi:hypothetical protein